MPVSSQELKQALAYCTGTEHYYRHPLLPFLYTDGIATFVDKAEASWFLTDMVLYLQLFAQNYMTAIKLIVKDGKADVILTNDDGKVIKKHHYSYTDCPDGEYVFYMFWKEQEKPILIYSSEY